jgi:hypothetical protein
VNIIQKQPNPSGAYPPIQSWSEATPPDGYYAVADGVELSHGGFGTLTVEEGIVTAFTPDAEAWERWQAEHPAPEPPIDDITALQLAVAELAEAQAADQTANELALAELAEIVLGG